MEWHAWSRLADEERNLLLERFECPGGSATWTGLADLDQMLGTPDVGSVMLVGGSSPGMRSAFVLTAAVNAARRGHPTLLASTTTSLAQLRMRLFSAISGVALEDLRSGRLDQRAWTAIAHALDLDLPLRVIAESRGSDRHPRRAVPRVLDAELVVLDGHRRLPDHARRSSHVVWATHEVPTRVRRRESIDIQLSLGHSTMTNRRMRPITVTVERSRVSSEGSVGVLFDEHRQCFVNSTDQTPPRDRSEDGTELTGRFA